MRIKHGALRLLGALGARKTVASLLSDEPELKLLPLLVDPQKTAIDIGAAEGCYSLRLQRLAKRCVAFEPNPYQCQQLRKTLPTVDVRQLAVSSEPGETLLLIPAVNGVAYSGWGTIETTNNTLNQLRDHVIESIPVKKCRLDDISFEGGVGFIKIDVEGHELDVLMGAGETVRTNRPVILVELSGYPKETFEMLYALNYTALALHNGLFEITSPSSRTATNVIFMPNR